MANDKISQLPLATSPLDSAVEMPVVQGGVTKRAGMTTIGFLQSGTGAVLQTAQTKMREIVSAKDFGAVGDGVADDRAALLLALQSGNIVDGLGLTYAISSELLPTSFKGLRNCNLKWSTVGAMQTQQALLFIRDLSDWFVENCGFDMGNQENTGSADDSTRNGLRVTTSSPNVTFNERVRVQNCRFTGFGNGTRLSVRSCRGVIVTGNFVSGSQVAFSPDPTNDCQNGIDITQCIDAVVSDNRVYSLQTRLSGILTKRFSRGILFTETRNSTVTGNQVSFVDQGFDFSGGWDAVTNTNGNVGISVTGNEANDIYTYGFKFANVARDIAVSGCVARRFGLAGFVFSGSSTVIADTTKNTQRINVSGCHAADATGEFSSNGRGFWVAQQATSVGWPRGIQINNCTVSNTLAGNHLLRAFDNEVTYDGSSLLPNQINNCWGTGYTGALQVGFVPWRVELTGTAAQAIANSNTTSITWDAETMDGWAGHTGSSATVTIALPGLYRVTFAGAFASNTTGFRRAKIQLNGGDVDGGTFTAAPVNGDVTSLGGTVELTLAAGNTLRVDVFQNSGGNLDFNTQDSVFIVGLIAL